MNIERTINKLIEFRMKEIHLADEKANRLVSMSIGGGVLTVISKFLIHSQNINEYVLVFSVIPLLLFGFALSFALITLYPRRLKRKSTTIWSDVMIADQCKSDDDTQKLTDLINNADEDKENAKLTIQLANITCVKYDCLRKATYCFIFAVASIFIYLTLLTIISLFL